MSDVDEAQTLSFQQTLQLINDELSNTEFRLQALRKINDAIKANDAFTLAERDHINEQCNDCMHRIKTLQALHAEKLHYLEHTVKVCAEQISERERILNELFSDPQLGKFSDLMSMFAEHHNILKETVKDAEE